MAKGTKPHAAWGVLTGICVFEFIGYGLIINCFGLFLLPMSEGMGLSVTEVSMTHAVRTICGTLGSLVAGRLMPVTGMRKYFGGVCLLLALGAGLFTLADSYRQLLAISAVFGFAVGMSLYTLAPLVLCRWFEKPGGFIGVAVACGGAGGIFFSPVLSHIIAAWGWQAGYWLIAALILCVMMPVALMTIRYSPEDAGLQPYAGKGGIDVSGKPETSGRKSMSLRRAVRSPLFYMVILFFIATAMLAGTYTHVPGMLKTKGYGEITAGYLYSFYQTGGMISQLLFGFVLARFGFRRAMPVLMGLIALGVAGLANFGGWAAPAAFFVLLMGASRAVGVVAGPVFVMELFGTKHYTSIFSSLYTAYLGFVALTTPLYGMFYDATGGYSSVYALLLVAALAVTAVTLLSLLLQERSAHRPKNIQFTH